MFLQYIYAHVNDYNSIWDDEELSGHKTLKGKKKKMLWKEDDTLNKENIMPLSGNLRITLIVARIYIQQLILPEKQTKECQHSNSRVTISHRGLSG